MEVNLIIQLGTCSGDTALRRAPKHTHSDPLCVGSETKRETETKTEREKDNRFPLSVLISFLPAM